MSMHTSLAGGRWNEFPLHIQLANVGSEVARALAAKKINNTRRLNPALDRMLELLDLTIADQKNQTKLQELCRLREVLCDYFWGENEYQSSPENLDTYFLTFSRSGATES
jgi:hypothetical protein